MPARIFINGMGTIGREILRQAFTGGSMTIVGVNDTNLSPKAIAYLLNYDSAGQGLKRMGYEATYDDQNISIDGTKIPVYAIANVAELPLGDLGADVALDCTGIVTSKIAAQEFINAGAKNVIVCNPMSNDVPYVCYGINEDTVISDANQIYCMGSCTTLATALLLNAVKSGYDIQNFFVRSVHAYTADQQTTDGGDASYPERGRAAANNIVPTFTNEAKQIGLFIPELNGKGTGQAFRVPVLQGSAVDITLCFSKEVGADEINAQIKGAASDVLTYTEDPIVSSDVIGAIGKNYPTVTLSAAETVSVGNIVNIVGLYDNVCGFAHQAVLIAEYMENSMRSAMYSLYTSMATLPAEEQEYVPIEEFDWRTMYSELHKDDGAFHETIEGQEE